MKPMRRLLARILLAPALVAASIMASASPALAADTSFLLPADQHYLSDCGRFWPSTGYFQTTHLSGENYIATLDFKLTQSQINSLACVSQYLELDFRIFGFSTPSEWDGYTVSTNIPGAVHDTAQSDYTVNRSTPGVTGIVVANLQANTEYQATIAFNQPLNSSDGSPRVSVEWVPSYWAASIAERSFCAAWQPIGGVPECIFGKTRVYLSHGYNNNVSLIFDGYRWWEFGPSTLTSATYPTSDIAPVPPSPQPPPPVPWNFENLDGDPGSIGHQNYDLGRQPTLIEFNGGLHAFYHDASNGYLRHAWADSGGWHFEIFDGSSSGGGGRIGANLGGTPTVMNFGGVLQVFYYDFTNHALRHAASANGINWGYETLDGATSTIAGHTTAWVGKTANAVMTPDGRLQVFYYDETNGNLRHAWWNGSVWSYESLDGGPGAISTLNADLGTDATTVVFNGVLHVFYRDTTNGNLRHAWDHPTTGWHFENLDGDPGSIAGLNADTGSNPVAVVYNSTLQLFYYDVSNGNLRHAWDNGTTGWQFENLEGSPSSVSQYDSDVGQMPTATVLGTTLQVYYYEPNGGNLRHAFSDATGWHFENLDGAGGSPSTRYNANVGWDPTAVAYNGHVQLLYYDVTNNNLRHAWSQ